MSHVDRLAILGVRSFSPEDTSYIKFFSPFTLIVGPNGSGKTTIIECLRYACTGDLPPNSKGGAFIHDTKVAGTTEVKAQIRLKFIDINGQRMICSRSLSLTQKRSTVQQKTLDNTLQRHDPDSGEITSISSRCADMDAILPVYLGVPKAILDNVVFCHQEESNWPLSEPSVLKKKFDEIFASTRYTKALTSIKDVRKERAQEVRVDQAKLAGLKSDTEKAQRVRLTLEDLTRQFTVKRDKVSNVDAQLTTTAHDIDSLLEIYKKAEDIDSRLAQTVHERRVLEQDMLEMAKTLSNREESDEELRSLLNEFTNDALADEEKLSDLRFEKSRLEHKLQSSRDAISAKLTDLGRLQAAAEANTQRMQDRQNMLHAAAEELNLQHISSGNISRATEIIKELVQSRDDTVKRIKAGANNEHTKLTDDLQRQKTKKAGLEESIKHTRTQIEQGQNVTGNLQSQLASIHASRSEYTIAAKRVEAEQATLGDLQARSKSDDFDNQLAQKERSLRGLEDDVNTVSDEMSRLSRHGDTRTKLALKRSDRDNKNTAAQALFDECKVKMRADLKREPSRKTLEKDLMAFLDEKASRLEIARRSQMTTNSELSAAEARLSVAKQSLSEKQQEADDLEQSVKAECGDKALPDELQQIEDTLQDDRQKIATLGGATLMYERFLRKTKQSSHCPLCVRQFAANEELQKFLKKLEETLEKIPRQQQDLERAAETSEQQHQKIKGLEKAWNVLETIRQTELPALERTCADYENDVKSIARALEAINAEVEDVEEEQRRAKVLLKQSEDMTRQWREADELTKEIEALEAELSQTGSTRTVTDCQRELEDLSDKGKSIRRDIKRLQGDREASMKAIQQAENAVRDAREKMTHLKYQMDTRERVEKELEHEQQRQRELAQALKDHAAAIQPLDAAINRSQSQWKQSQDEWNEKLEKAQASAHQARQSLEKLESLNAGIDAYTRTAGPGQLEKIMLEKEEMERAVEIFAFKCEDVDNKIRGLENDMADRKGKERELSDQLRYRSKQQQALRCDDKLVELRAEQARYEKPSYERQLQKLKDTQAKLIDTRGGLHGEIRQMQDQIDRYQHELDSEYEQVEKRYHRQFVQVKTTEMAISDLDKYSKALETAIMRYHSLKMQDLNKIIRDLWVNTYRGGDIDYIEIRSDNEGSASNRSFNYRVVMVKNGTELNMRGRCSAGQKVLTSIIVRLALAETFCINCGILTLDEPTTNLDRDNVESLAESLARIIRGRRAQSNFQLIVITHDEEFVEYLARSDVADYYYRVSKDEKQYSEIKRQAIHAETIAI